MTPLPARKVRIGASMWFLMVMCSLIGGSIFVACTKPLPPIYDPPPKPGPVDPTPTPKPVPSDIASWAVAAPLIGAQTVPLASLDAGLGPRRGERVDPVTKEWIVEYWAKNEAGTARLFLYAHFVSKTATVSKSVEVR